MPLSPSHKDLIRMALCCILPFLILFLLPLAGLGNTAAVTGFLLLVFGFHLLHMLLLHGEQHQSKSTTHHER